MSRAIEHILRLQDQRDTLVCAGIDPNPARFPMELREGDTLTNARTFLTAYVDLVAPSVCAFKAQKAYFDALPGGHALLGEIIAHVHRAHDTPVIVDGKIGDIDETMRAYRHVLLEEWKADGVLVNPYMGDDVFAAFADDADTAIVVLVKSSNPGGAVVQDVPTAGGLPLWQHVLQLSVDRWNAHRNIIPVIASTQGVDLAHVRGSLPDDMPVFFAGMGAQGGSADALRALLDSRGRGVLVNSSRGLLYPQPSVGQTWQQAIAAAAQRLRDELNAQRRR